MLHRRVSARLEPAADSREPLAVGMDGGYVRGRNKQGCFEVIAGNGGLAEQRGQAHPLMQTRTRMLNDEQEGLFQWWYPGFQPPPRYEASADA